MKKLFLLIISILFIGNFANANETGGKFGIGIKGGAAKYYGDLDESSFGLHYAVSVDYWFTDVFGIGFNYGKNELSAEETGNYFESNLWNYILQLRINVWPSSKLNPYLTIGYEWFDSNPKDKNGTWLRNFASDIEPFEYKSINNAVPFGLGFSYYLSNVISFDAEALLHYSFIDYVDGYIEGAKDDHWMSLAAGISLHFGKANDTDGDGIPDSRDKDPFHAEDFDNFQDEDGAPDLDNDQDGIPDAVDKAPIDPEDRDGFEDGDGVPDLDNDKDGVLDSNDKAPNEAEDHDGFEDEDGIPDTDNDQDGILDVDDKCPDEAETFNEYEETDGCPDTKPELAVEKGQAIVLDGVNFASGSVKLTINSKTILDKVVRTMTKNPELEVEIHGYTDNTGSYNGNIKISQRRADSVKDYIVTSGISATRISTIGFGPENPIASNDTSEGRAKNRRIEFFRTK